MLPPVCSRCGLSLDADGACPDCLPGLHHLSALRSWAIYDGPVRSAIHSLKYRGETSLGEILARPLIEILSDLDWQIDLVTPVPLGEGRRKERGYNQAALLARPLALARRLNYHPEALERVRPTRTQVGLSRLDRRRNVAGAFVANPKVAEGKRVLMVDDVLTSGATLEACAQALHAAGATQVYGLTLTRAIPNGRRGTA